MKGGWKILLVLIAIIALIGIGEALVKAAKKGVVAQQVTMIADQAALPYSGTTMEPYTTASGLQITVTQPGTGAEAKSGDSVSVNYTGKFDDGTAFDSNVDPKFHHVEPFIFTLGAGMVIKGWDEGVAGMKVGEKRTLVIPYTLGYGENGYGPIPPKATLTFDVELVAVN